MAIHCACVSPAAITGSMRTISIAKRAMLEVTK